jgi:hypothetical protein
MSENVKILSISLKLVPGIKKHICSCSGPFRMLGGDGIWRTRPFFRCGLAVFGRTSNILQKVKACFWGKIYQSQFESHQFLKIGGPGIYANDTLLRSAMYE